MNKYIKHNNYKQVNMFWTNVKVTNLAFVSIYGRHVVVCISEQLRCHFVVFHPLVNLSQDKYYDHL